MHLMADGTEIDSSVLAMALVGWIEFYAHTEEMTTDGR
jgi:hypothetical protein